MTKNIKLIEDFQITKDIIQNFVLLSGDKNSLHIDPLFSNRSNYKDCIAHGMLPVLFLAKFKKRKDNSKLRLKKIAVNFKQPVFLNDELIIEIDIQPERIEFSICNKLSGNEVTNGYVLYEPSNKKTTSKKNIELKSIIPIVLDAPDEAIYQFDDIYTGQKEKINLLINEGHNQLLNTILGVDYNHQSLIEETDLLIVSALSTFIGMRLPGQLATFTNLLLEFNSRTLLDNSYTLKGDVSFKSKSTRVIKTKVSFIDSKTDKEFIYGHVKTKINSPHTIMPSIDELYKNDVFELQGKVALITGSSRGIGETTAKLLALHGAYVIINYRKSKIEAEKIVEEIISKGGKAIAIEADVSDKKEVLQMFSMINDNFGRIDILINNAVGSVQPISFEDLSWDQIQKDIEIIVKGTFNCCKEAIKCMKKNQSGKIINLTTIATDIPPKSQGKYVIAKSALVGLTRSLAVELASDNIQVNMVSPSFIETDLTNNMNELFKDKMRSESPMNRFANSVEVANAVVFLSSSMSSFISGQKITLGGGQPPFL
jgi:3-oxoacyl-[acyl-carrier protein] reductase